MPNPLSQEEINVLLASMDIGAVETESGQPKNSDGVVSYDLPLRIASSVGACQFWKSSMAGLPGFAQTPSQI